MLEGFYYYKLLLESALVGAVRCRHMFPGTCSGWGAAGLSSEMESRSAMVARMFHEGAQREKGAPAPGPGAGAGAAEAGREAAGAASGTGAKSSRPATAIEREWGSGGAGGAGQAPA